MESTIRTVDHLRRIQLPDDLRGLFGDGDKAAFSIDTKALSGIYLASWNPDGPDCAFSGRIDSIGRVNIPLEISFAANIWEYDIVSLRAAPDNSHIIVAREQMSEQRAVADVIAMVINAVIKRPVIITAEYGTIAYAGPLEYKLDSYKRNYFFAAAEWMITEQGQPYYHGNPHPAILDVCSDIPGDYFTGYDVGLIRDGRGKLLGAILCADDGTVEEYSEETARSVISVGTKIMKIVLEKMGPGRVHQIEWERRVQNKMDGNIITRKIDDLGRIVLPKDARHYLGLEDNDLLAITVNDGSFVLTPYTGDPGNVPPDITVRKIDDLGRVTIPKDIRKMLRVKELDPVEITWNKASIKLTPFAEFMLKGIAQEYAENLNRVLDLPVAVANEEKTIAYAGPDTYREFAENQNFHPLVQGWLEKVEGTPRYVEMAEPKLIMSARGNQPEEPIDCYHVTPLVSRRGDLFGSVLVMDDLSNRSLPYEAYIAGIQATTMRLVQELGC